jgi:flagella basal body P-ring formation protein FlgA
MTSFNLSSMSIVENKRCAWLFAAFFLLLCSTINTVHAWEASLRSEIIAHWQQLGGDPELSEVSFPTLTPGYALPTCESPRALHFIRNLQPGRNGIELSCDSPYWTQSLAIELHVYDMVVILKEGVIRDRPIHADQLTLVRMDTSSLHQGHFNEPEQVVGMMARRTIRKGTPLTPDMIEPFDIIERGQPLTIKLQRPGISIEMKGKALASGHIGERIRVKNEQSGSTVYAEIVADGLVQVR